MNVQYSEINLVYKFLKNDAELYFINHLRTITLLNTDYKIAAKSTAKRVKLALLDLVDHDQMGFLKDRFVGADISH